jgi:hypothetical protein
MNITAVLLAATLALACTAAHADDEATAPAPKPLDLRAPDVSKLYTQRQLDRLIAKMEADFIERIEVEGARVPSPEFTPRVWPSVFAPFWALLNPTQAWRIFAPIPPDQARHIGNQDFTTEGHLEPLGVPPGDPFKQ